MVPAFSLTNDVEKASKIEFSNFRMIVHGMFNKETATTKWTELTLFANGQGFPENAEYSRAS